MEPGTNERKVIGRVNCRGEPAHSGWVRWDAIAVVVSGINVVVVLH